MDIITPYWRKRLRRAFRAQFHERAWWRWVIDTIAVPIVMAVITLIHTLIDPGEPFAESPVWFQQLGAWNVVHLILAAFLVFIMQVIFQWSVRAPGHLDQQRQSHIQSLKDKVELLNNRIDVFEKRLRPNIWITGKPYGGTVVIDSLRREVSVGFAVENKSDDDLYDVKVELAKIEWSQTGQSDYICCDTTVGIHLPVALEWRPDEQESEGVSSTAIPAGASRWIGLFSERTVLSANHNIRSDSLDSLSFDYKVLIRLSARGIPAIKSPDYEICRVNRGCAFDVRNIPYEVTPKAPYQLANPQTNTCRHPG